MSKKIRNLQDILDILSIALARKKASIKFLTYGYEKAASEDLKKTFSLIIEQEKNHEEILRAKFQQVKEEIELEKSKRT